MCNEVRHYERSKKSRVAQPLSAVIFPNILSSQPNSLPNPNPTTPSSTMCTISNHIQIRLASRAAYDDLARFHYRSSCPAVPVAIYAMYNSSSVILSVAKNLRVLPAPHSQQPNSLPSPIPTTLNNPIGIIVYTMPAMELAARNRAIPNLFKNCRTRKDRIKTINENIRTISRVIIDPRYRGLGLAARLVRETMPLLNVPIIEAVAAMGRFNPFFQKAGMTAYPAKLPRHSLKMRDTLELLRIRHRDFIYPSIVQQQLDSLPGQLKFYLEHEIRLFLAAYGKRKNMPPGLERTRFILSKLSSEPVYYIWFKRFCSL
jgi:hypothetical protein